MVQNGCRLFRTDEAIISPDWISNECLVCAYDSLNREFAWVNRPYELTRNGYNAKMKNHRGKDTPRAEALTQSSYARARANLKSYPEQGKNLRPGEMRMTTDPEELPPLVRKREGLHGPFNDSIALRTRFFWSSLQSRNDPKRQGSWQRKRERKPSGRAGREINQCGGLHLQQQGGGPAGSMPLLRRQQR